MPQRPSGPRPDLRNAEKIFSDVMEELERQHGREQLTFPKEIMWLGGAPGSGKGTNTPFILRERDISAPPIVMSELLDTPEMRAIKDNGQFISDDRVVHILFGELLKPIYKNGVVVDGFPRTNVQVECVRLLHTKMLQLRREFFDTPVGPNFRRPIFHITLLYVSERISIERQLRRGREILENNREVEETGVGQKLEARKTDFDERLARARYELFKNETMSALNSLRDVFHYHFIDANGDLATVEQNIIQELSYQSSLELGEDTYDSVRNIPLSSELTRHARQEMVRRLDNYRHRHADQFAAVVRLIEDEFMPALRRHAAVGRALIRSDDPVLNSERAQEMAIDIFTERGYRLTVSVEDQHVPVSIDPNSYRVTTALRRVWVFEVRFRASEIRRGGH